MGNIRPKFIKRSAERLAQDYPERFNEKFEHNKKAVSDLLILPSKRLRNLIAGYLTSLVKRME